jgi:lipopolysaccharide assembly outer membrane protein LptD (OstA)
MVSKIEYVLVAVLVLFLFLANQTEKEFEDIKRKATRNIKNIELSVAKLREVNATTLLNDIHAEYAYKIGETWHFMNFFMSTPEIKSLKAAKAKGNDNNIFMENNVSMLRSDGTLFLADKIRYDRKKQVLYSFGKFEIHKEKSIAKGYDLYYDVKLKFTEASEVYGKYYFKEKIQKKQKIK